MLGTALLFVRRHWLAALCVVLATAAAIGVGVLVHQRNMARAQLRTTSLAEANDRAAADTLARILTGSAGDATWQRLAEQREQARDSLDRALKQTRAVTAELRATVQQLRTQVASIGDVTTTHDTTANAGSSASSPTTDAGDIRHANFHVRERPYTADADVALPAVGRGSLALRVALDTATIDIAIGCAELARAGGVHDARLTVHASDWLTLAAPRVSQDPKVCSPAAAPPPPAAPPWYRPRVLLGGGSVYASGWHTGPGVFVGWPVF